MALPETLSAGGGSVPGWSVVLEPGVAAAVDAACVSACRTEFPLGGAVQASCETVGAMTASADQGHADEALTSRVQLLS
ncbi:MAG: hypothetical protein KUG77_07930 [Nannocystaceae bacterium]|nr:hypothetical protein [Nannocystaceae bacterium]